MNNLIEIETAIGEILKDDPRYQTDAYLLVLDAIHYTGRMLDRKGHITARELLDGLRQYAGELYGPMAKTVLNEWGINNCEDFGNIVFNLVNRKLLGKTENDSIGDFRGGYDFTEAFDSQTP